VTAPADGNGADEDDDPSLGPPLTELREISFAVGDRFAGRVRGRLERRMLTGEVLELLCVAPLTMLLEFLRWPFEGISRDRQ
jgi:hypothetical protein